MIVDDLDIGRTSLPPDKTYPPLIIDADRILPPPASFEDLEPVPGRSPKIVDDARLIEQTNEASATP
jgi:hypothetical protein